jgi:hypothetical protein
VGSLPYIDKGLGYLENSYTQQSVVDFNAAVSAAGGSRETALANRQLLVPAGLPNARPERITSFEAGYKSVLLNNTLVIDLDAYINAYDGFLGQVQVFVPHGVTIGSDTAVLAMLDKNRNAQDRYRVYTNARNTYHNYGSALGITWNFYRKFTAGGALNYNKMKSNKTNDVFVTGFNTPDWSGNISFGNKEIVKNIGFNVVWRWQNGFLWESPLVTGNISAFSTVDAQVSFHLPKVNSTIKLGGSNLLDHRYLQYAGGPTIGGLYYAAITIDGLLK